MRVVWFVRVAHVHLSTRWQVRVEVPAVQLATAPNVCRLLQEWRTSRTPVHAWCRSKHAQRRGATDVHPTIGHGVAIRVK